MANPYAGAQAHSSSVEGALPGFESSLYPFLTWRPQANYLIPLYLCLLISKIGMMMMMMNDDDIPAPLGC